MTDAKSFTRPTGKAAEQENREQRYRGVEVPTAARGELIHGRPAGAEQEDPDMHTHNDSAPQLQSGERPGRTTILNGTADVIETLQACCHNRWGIVRVAFHLES